MLDGDWTEIGKYRDDVLTQVLLEIERLFGLSTKYRVVECSLVEICLFQSTKCEQQHFTEGNLTIIGDGTQTERGLSGAILSVERALLQMP